MMNRATQNWPPDETIEILDTVTAVGATKIENIYSHLQQSFVAGELDGESYFRAVMIVTAAQSQGSR